MNIAEASIEELQQYRNDLPKKERLPVAKEPVFVQDPESDLRVNFDDVYVLADKRGVSSDIVDSAAIVYSSQSFENMAKGTIGYTGPGLIYELQDELYAPVIHLKPLMDDVWVNPNLRHEISHWGDPNIEASYYNKETVGNLRSVLMSLGGVGVSATWGWLESMGPAMKGVSPEAELMYEGARFSGLSLALGAAAFLSSERMSLSALQGFSPRELEARCFSLRNCHINPIHNEAKD